MHQFGAFFNEHSFPFSRIGIEPVLVQAFDAICLSQFALHFDCRLLARTCHVARSVCSLGLDPFCNFRSLIGVADFLLRLDQLHLEAVYFAEPALTIIASRSEIGLG